MTVAEQSKVATERTRDDEIVITRIFDAPRSLVYKAWTDPKHLREWWGPHGFTNPRVDVDLRPGGAWHIDMRSPDGTVYPNKGKYLEVVKDEKIVYTDEVNPADAVWGGNPPPSATHTVIFEDYQGKTRVIAASRLASAAERARMIKLGALEGFGQMLERLEALLKVI